MPSFVREERDGAVDDDFTTLWERHIDAARRDFRPKPVGEGWDAKMDSVVDALDELALQSPHSRQTPSPDLWSAHDDYSETAPSSPPGSTVSPTLVKTPAITISSSDYPDPGTPMVEIGGRHSRGKELASYYLDRTRLKKLRDWHNNKPGSVPAVDAKQLAYRNYRSRYVPGAEPDTPVTSFRAVLREQTPPPTDVRVLILTWAKHDRRGDDGQLLSPGLDIETDTARTCFKRRGYKVQCRVIPEDYPTSAVETVLGRFLNQSAPGTLLMVYYRGHGNMEGDRMVFSSGFGGSYFYWDDVRDPIMQAPGDVLLVLDCSAAPGTETPEIRMDGGLTASPSTKQLLGVCAPYSLGTSCMTKSLCRTLDKPADGGRMASVQSLCSQMKADLRRQEVDASVFVTQLGGGQLADIYLPEFR